MLEDQTRDLGLLLPMVEPVNAQPRDLIRCIAMCDESGQRIGVIVNPNRHELRHPTTAAAWRDGVAGALAKEVVIPTLKCGSETLRSDVSAFLRAFPRRKVALAVFGEMSIEDAKWVSAQRSIEWIVASVGEVSSDFLGTIGTDRSILLKDNFRKLPRNADYSGKEVFTDLHRTFRGRAAGFGDYLCVGSRFDPGGGAPAAVVIHAIYKHRTSGDIWVEHFVSNDVVQGEGDVASKFVQAARKLARAVTLRPDEFGSNPALQEYVRLAVAAQFPQLATNKKLQMIHHMCVCLDILENRL